MVVTSKAAPTQGEGSAHCFWVPVSLIVVGVALRTYGIAHASLSGDEFGSVSGARDLGANWNSIAYFAFMHVWINLGSSEWFLRLPALSCGALTIPVMYKIGQYLGGNRLAFAAGVLCALSPFNIAHSQEVRFYTLLPLAASLSFFTTVRYQGGHRSLLDKGALWGSLFLVITSHFLGIIVAGVCTISLFSTRVKPKTVFVVTLVLIALITLALSSAAVQRLAWDFIHVYGDAKSTTAVVVTPLSFVNVVKIFFSLFVFCLGYEVYPLWLWLILPAFVLYAFLCFKGALWVRSQPVSGVVVLLTGLAFLAVFLVLDPFGGRVATGVAPRHASFFWPILVLLLAGGIARCNRLFWPILFLVGIVNLAALACRWDGSWSMSPGTNWHEAIAFLDSQVTVKTVIVHDGRSDEGLSFYGNPDWHRVSAWNLEQSPKASAVTDSSRVIFIANDYQDDRRMGLTNLLQRLQVGRIVTSVRVRYPLFEYVLEPAKAGKTTELPLPAYAALDLPLEIHDLRFQDLQLPVLFSWQASSYEIMGTMGLPTMVDCDSISIRCYVDQPATAVLLLSNLSDYGNTQIGDCIADLSVRQSDSISYSFPIRNGIETDDWLFNKGRAQPFGSASESSYQIAHTWHKRMQVVGKNAYEGAWVDGDAKIYSTRLALPAPMVPRSLTVRLLKREGEGKIHIWGILLKRESGEP